AATGTNASDFYQTNTCGTSLAAGASCTISVIGRASCRERGYVLITVADSAAGSPHTAALSGTGVGVAQASLSPSAVTFGNQNLGTTSAAQTITLSNAGSAALPITSIAATGTNASDFQQTNSCGASLAAAASCTISVTFTPSVVGARSASITFADSAACSPHTAALTEAGLGVAPISLPPSSLTFRT